MAEKEVALFVYYGWLSISPSIVGIVRTLSERGYLVDVVYLYDEKHGPFIPDVLHVGTVPVVRCGSRYSRLIWFLIACWRAVKGKSYSAFVGIDPEGIIVAGIIGRLKRVPCVYYSLEILAKEDIAKTKGVRKLLLTMKKGLEAHFSRRAQVVVVQDKNRADVLVRDNGMNADRILLIPNAYDLSDQDRAGSEVCLVPMPEGKRIVIYAGSIIPQMRIADVLRHMDSWPKDAFFLLHTPYASDYLDEVRQLIREKCIEENVLVSVKRLSPGQLSALVRKAHIGIAICDPIDKNHELCPSGKVALYLSSGLPIIVNDIPPSRTLIARYHCGVCIDAIDRIGDAIQTILSDYSEYSANARTCYKEEMEVSKGFAELVKRIEVFSQEQELVHTA